MAGLERGAVLAVSLRLARGRQRLRFPAVAAVAAVETVQMPADRRLARLDLPAEEVVALDRLTKLEQVLLAIVPFERARDHPLVGTAAPGAQRRQPSRVAIRPEERWAGKESGRKGGSRWGPAR